MRKLTRRETVMLFVLVCILLIAGGLYFLLLPLYNSNGKLQSQIADEKLTKIEMQKSIDGDSEADLEIDSLSGELAADAALFYPPKTDWELDGLITGMLQSHNLNPQSLHVSPPVGEDIVGYGAAAKPGTSTTQKSGTSDTAVSTAGSAKLLVSHIKADVLGTKNDFLAFSDEIIAGNPSIRITGFTMDDSSLNNESGKITIDIEVIMYDESEG